MIEEWMVSFFGKNLSGLVVFMFYTPVLLTATVYGFTKLSKLMDRNNKDK